MTEIFAVFYINLYAPTSEYTTMNKRLRGALGIPELKPPNRRWTFNVKSKEEKKICRTCFIKIWEQSYTPAENHSRSHCSSFLVSFAKALLRFPNMRKARLRSIWKR